jgi:hypothetical protein
VTEENDSPEIEDVRRLLADTRHTGPIPDDVAARMDAVLADLGRTSDDAPPSAGAQLVSLAAHRRRRAGSLLVAAAAIVVGGVVVAQQLPHDGSSSSATAGGTTDNQALGNTGSGHDSRAQTPGTKPDVERAHTKDGSVVVHPQHFSADALAGRRLLFTRAAQSAHPGSLSSCVEAPRHAQLLKAVFRHAPAVLVYHRPAGSTQVVDLFVCGSARPLKSVTLPTG